MTNRRLVAYVLIGLGTITLLARLSDGAGWLWIGLVAAAMLFAYARQRTYGLLVLGGILAGTATGILLQEVFRNEAFFLISLGAGIAAIDLVERRPSRWPRTFGAVLAALGVLIGLANAGAFASVWFALLLIAAGIALISRGPDARPFPPPRTDAPPTAHPPRQSAHGTPAHGVAPDERARPASPNAPSATGPDPTGVGARRARLAAWRERTSAAEGRAPQAILADDVLQELAETVPSDLPSLANARGIGPVKLERYGTELLAVLSDESR
ncbi:hypothetical protein BH23DEI1_BH23DEI1_10530 [soil metagenome]